MLAKSQLFLVNIKQILIRFVYMRDQTKKWELQAFIWAPRQMDFVMEDYLIGDNIVMTYNIITHM